MYIVQKEKDREREGARERGRKREGGREGVRERGRKREGGREGGREGEGEECLRENERMREAERYMLEDTSDDDVLLRRRGREETRITFRLLLVVISAMSAVVLQMPITSGIENIQSIIRLTQY